MIEKPFLYNVNYKILKREAIHYQIHLFALMILAFSMPLSPAIMSISQVLLVLNFLVEPDLKNRFKLLSSNHAFWFFLSFFLIYIVGMIYTTNINQGLKEIKIKLPLLLIPIALAGKSELILIDFKKILLAAIAGVLVTSFVGMYIYLTEKPEELRDISPFISHIRLSLMLCMAIFSALYLITNSGKSKILYKTLLAVTAIWLLTFIGILGARSGYLVILVVAVFVGLTYLLKQRKYILAGALALLLFIVPVSMYKFTDSVRTRINEIPAEIENYRNGENVSGQSISQRFVYWAISLELIKENPVLGVGTGDTDFAFKNYYATHQVKLEKKFQFTSHMQYLNITISFGLIGLIIFFVSVLYPPFLLNRYSDYLMISFLITLFISMLTEDTLETQAGITFFAFYNSLLLFAKPKPA